ncbi:hypothetical protein N7488_005108 [Penicillium malachiteum]|nr:hypothetical protein N7488_005108 [Penicillium malachiteum]
MGIQRWETGLLWLTMKRHISHLRVNKIALHPSDVGTSRNTPVSESSTIGLGYDWRWYTSPLAIAPSLTLSATATISQPSTRMKL